VNRVTTCIRWSIAKGTGLLQDEVPHPSGIHGTVEEQHHVMRSALPGIAWLTLIRGSAF
jgi:hypothetical protein